MQRSQSNWLRKKSEWPLSHCLVSKAERIQKWGFFRIASGKLMQNRSEETLDYWQEAFSKIYFESQNYERSAHLILLHVFEEVLNLQKAAAKRNSFEECRDVWLPKLFAWYCALLKCLGFSTGVADHVWKKFPRACPFCLLDT